MRALEIVHALITITSYHMLISDRAFHMEWIQKHISGDPKRVTMYACSTFSGVWSSLDVFSL